MGQGGMEAGGHIRAHNGAYIRQGKATETVRAEHHNIKRWQCWVKGAKALARHTLHGIAVGGFFEVFFANGQTKAGVR